MSEVPDQRRHAADPPETAAAGAPGLYVHLPFCTRICPYCDFAVTPLGRSGPRRLGRYQDALHREIALRAGVAEGPLKADTVYFGGGTPSLAPVGFFRQVVGAAVDAGFAVPEPLVFLEANPEDVAGDPGLARRWAAEGVAAVSLGAQALDDARLQFLGRAHTARDVDAAVSRLAKAGIPWISIDLIFGTAGQRGDALRAELEAAAGLPGVSHISAYELTIEPGTSFGRRDAAGEVLTIPPGEGGALFREVHETLAKRGFPAYEASNFASAPKFRSRHNQKYWNGAPYLGIGPSAHSFDPERAERSWNHRTLGDWENAVRAGSVPIAGREILAPGARALEELFLRLRTTDGLDCDRFSARYGAEVVQANRELFSDWRTRGLVRLTGPEPARVRPTLEGLAVADNLAREVDLTALRDRNAA